MQNTGKSREIAKIRFIPLVILADRQDWLGGGGDLPGIWACCILKTSLFVPTWPLYKTPISDFLVRNDPIFALNHKYLENLHFNVSKFFSQILVKFQF